MSNLNIIEILLVEDNDGDVFLIKKAFESAKIANHIKSVEDGEGALKYLEDLEASNQNFPDLILLDINLPKKNGKDTLREIKNSGNLRHIPIVMLTSSNRDRDIIDCYELQASSYIEKPVTLDKFYDVVKAIEDFWFTIVKLPKK